MVNDSNKFVFLFFSMNKCSVVCTLSIFTLDHMHTERTQIPSWYSAKAIENRFPPKRLFARFRNCRQVIMHGKEREKENRNRTLVLAWSARMRLKRGLRLNKIYIENVNGLVTILELDVYTIINLHDVFLLIFHCESACVCICNKEENFILKRIPGRMSYDVPGFVFFFSSFLPAG